MAMFSRIAFFVTLSVRIFFFLSLFCTILDQAVIRIMEKKEF